MSGRFDPLKKNEASVLGSRMAYVEHGEGDPIVLIHGNPTSSFLWRKVIPELSEMGRCIAPDLIGMGDSQKIGGQYRFSDHAEYLEAFLDIVSVYQPNVSLSLPIGDKYGLQALQVFPRDEVAL